jgi:hypothetical protein
MTAMHLELFALAFFRRFNNNNQAIRQTIFTKQYLNDKNKPDIWEAMVDYNKIISRTATWGMTENTGLNRASILMNDDMRSLMAEQWGKDNKIDVNNLTIQDKENLECVARACNRVGADIMKNQEMGNRQISVLFLERLGGEKLFGKQWQPSADFFLALASQPYSQYEFAERFVNNINLSS